LHPLDSSVHAQVFLDQSMIGFQQLLLARPHAHQLDQAVFPKNDQHQKTQHQAED
jgi:hypothetical protein